MDIGEMRSLGSARVSRAGDGVFAIANFCERAISFRVPNFSKSLFRRDAETSTRDACATQSTRVPLQGKFHGEAR